MIEFVYQGI